VSDRGPAVVIINPVSGPKRRGAPHQRQEIAARTLEKLGAPADVELTRHAGHAYELAQAALARGARCVIAWGGDGTINEVGRALAHTPASLGLVPGGSGNGLARELKIPFDPAAAIERAIRGRDRVMDAGELNGHMFFNIAGAGLDGHVAGAVTGRLRHRGLIPYLAASARDLLKFRPSLYEIETDHTKIETTALIVAFANSRQYGFNARIAPNASSDDGLLDLVIIEDRTFLGNVARLPSLFLGTFDRQAGVRVIRVRAARIRAAAPVPIHIDGEATRLETELLVTVRASALRVRT
jgi:YegS/Rv2252/BmrU family lipid kinase